MQSSELTQTLSFGLDIHTGSGDDLQHGCLEARRIRNEANRLDKEGWGWNDIKSTVVDNADHVKNTSQLIVDKALGELETYHDHKHAEWRLHVTVTHEHAEVAPKHDADTIIGVDVNEDCIALAAMTRDGKLRDSVVVDYTDVKTQRHEFFTKRKRMQNAGQTAFETIVQTEERDYVHDRLHKVSRRVVEWVSQFERPVIVFEDLKDMRDSIDYGTRMNRRLHSLPFSTLQEMVSYKAAGNEIPSDEVDPEYTSQRCPRTACRHTERANRHKKRFNCCECGFQDHADRKAAVCVVQEWIDDQTENVPSLERLPGSVEVRRAASGAGGGPDSHGLLGSGVDRHGTSARPETEVREELTSVASAVPE